jgi:hypothetical protein
VSLAADRRRHLAFDVALALVLLALSLLDLVTHALAGVYPHSPWAHVPFIVLTALPMAVRRIWPLRSLIVFAVIQSVWIYTLFPLNLQPPLILFAQLIIIVFTAAAYSDGRAGRAAMLVGAVGILTDIPTLAIGRPLGEVFGPDVIVAVAFGVGLGYARLRRRGEALDVQAANAESEHLEAAERAAAPQRTRPEQARDARAVAPDS